MGWSSRLNENSVLQTFRKPPGRVGNLECYLLQSCCFWILTAVWGNLIEKLNMTKAVLICLRISVLQGSMWEKLPQEEGSHSERFSFGDRYLAARMFSHLSVFLSSVIHLPGMSFLLFLLLVFVFTLCSFQMIQAITFFCY